MNEELHAIISGTVQGVSFRYITFTHAKNLNLKGFVRNLPNGKVEILAQGPKRNLEKLLELLSNESKPVLITDVEYTFQRIKNTYSDFIIER